MIPQGITNFKNSCFLNSILQVLLSINGLQSVLSSWPSGEFQMSLTKCLLGLKNNSDREYLTVRQLLNDLPTVYRMLRQPFQQCDAEECLTQLLYGIEEEFGCHVFDMIFGGLMKQNRVCPCCTLTSFAAPAKFNVLPLAMTHDATSLNARVLDFHGGETLEETTHCARCGEDVVGAMTSYEVVKWPRTIILQLKRFASTSLTAVKEFDEVVDFEEEMHFGDVLYQLRSVVVHEGRSADSGHYFANVKRCGIWFRASDTYVRAVTFAEVKQCAGYLFVYERVEVPGMAYDEDECMIRIVPLDLLEEHVMTSEVPSVLPLEEPTPARPCTYHVPMPDIALNEPLYPDEYWESCTQLLTNFHINAALMTLMAGTTPHASASTPRHPNFLAPLSIQNFERVVEQARDMIRAGQVPNPPRRVDDPHLKCLIAAAHGTMNPSFVIGDGIHWRIVCIDATRRVIYTVDPFGSLSGFPQRLGDKLLDAFEPCGKWKVQNSRVPLQQSNDGANCGVWAIYTTLMWEEFLANLEGGETRECDFTTFLRKQTRPKVTKLRAQYLRGMKRIRGTQVEAPLVVEESENDPEGCVVLVEPNVTHMDCDASLLPMVDVGEVVDLTQTICNDLEKGMNGVGNTGDNELEVKVHDMNLKSINRGKTRFEKALEATPEKAKDDFVQPCDGMAEMLDEMVCDTPNYRLTSMVFNRLFEKFNDPHESPKAVARAIYEHLGSPKTLKIANIRAKVYNARKGCDDVEMIETHTDDTAKKACKGYHSLGPKVKLSREMFRDLFVKHKGNHSNNRAIAEAMYVDLGSPCGLEVKYIEQKIHRECKRCTTKEDNETDLMAKARLKCEFKDMFVRYNGSRDNVTFVARAIHADLGSPGNIGIEAVKRRVYKERKGIASKSPMNEWARDDLEVSNKIKELYDELSPRFESIENVACAMHKELEYDFDITRKQVKARILSLLAQKRKRQENDESSESESNTGCTPANHKRKHVRKKSHVNYSIKGQVLACELAFSQLPEHPCSSCGTLRFETSLAAVSTKVLEHTSEELIRVFKHDETGNLINRICSICKTSLKKKEVPEYCAVNGKCFVEVPEFIRELNPLEARLVAPKLAFGSIYQLPKGGQFGLKGGMVSVAADMSKIQVHLPRTFEECATLNCDLKRRLVFKNAFMKGLIRPELIMRSLAWLKDQPLYKGIGVIVRKDWEFMTQADEGKVEQDDMILNQAIEEGLNEEDDTQDEIDGLHHGVDEHSDLEEAGDPKNVRVEGLHKMDPQSSSQVSRYENSDLDADNVSISSADTKGSHSRMTWVRMKTPCMTTWIPFWAKMRLLNKQ